jgi:protein ATS1
MDFSSPTPTCLLSAGSNAGGQLAIGTLDDAHYFTPCLFDCPSQIQSLDARLPLGTTRIVKVAGGANHTLVMLDVVQPLNPSNKSIILERQLWGCGDGSSGQLGPNYETDVARARDRMRDGGWPADSSGVFRRLSYGDWQTQSSWIIKDTAAAWATSYVVLSCEDASDVILSMGSNGSDALGIGDARPEIVNVVNIEPLFDGPGVISVENIACGPRHVLVHLVHTPSDGSAPTALVAGWGHARNGQLGELPVNQVAGPRSAAGKPRSLSSMSRPSIILRVDAEGPGAVVSLATGDKHTLVLFRSGNVQGFGADSQGQIRGVGDWINVDAIGATWRGSYAAMLEAREVKGTGSNTHGQLARAPDLQVEPCATINVPVSPSFELVKLVCGSEHVLTFWKDGIGNVEVWGWGWNEHGNLGKGDTEDACLATRIWPPPITPPGRDVVGGHAVGLWAGCGTSWIAIA